jgi:hypothetical protein
VHGELCQDGRGVTRLYQLEEEAVPSDVLFQTLVIVLPSVEVPRHTKQ